MMPNLAHILKLIFLGPQPRDELYEEWSRNPLAEWFRDQRLARSDKWPGARMARRLREEWTFVLFICALLLYLIPYSPTQAAAIVVIVVLMLSGIRRFRFDSRKLRPPQRATFMFGVNVRRELLIDLWLSGVRGRDVAKMLYVEGGSLNSRIYDMAIVALVIIHFMNVLSSKDVTMPWVLLPIGFWTAYIGQRFGKITATNPFERIDHRFWGLRDIPGLRAMSNSSLTKEPIPGADIPVTPVVILLVAATIVMVLVGIEVFPVWVLYSSFAVLLAPFLLHVHRYGRRAPRYDPRMIEEEFNSADHDFDQWVRTELIGDEDAGR